MTSTHVTSGHRVTVPAPRVRPVVEGVPLSATGGPAARITSRVGIVALCTALVAALTVPDRLDHWAVRIALAGIVLGIPHGAVDHMVPFWSAGRRPGCRELATGLAGYVLVAAVAAAALIAWPTAMVLVFLVVSALHFGRGEVTFAAERDGRPTPDRLTDLAGTLAHGGIVVLLPLTVWHDRSAAVLGVLAPGLARPLPGALLAAGAVLVVGSALGVAALRAVQGRRRDAAELLLVLVVFLAVPPLVAFGVYFGAWHAVRHTGRLLTLPGPSGPLTPRAALARYARHAALPTVVACAALVVAGRVVSGSAVPVALAVLLALTFPHLRVVERWDRGRSARGLAGQR